MLTLRDYQQDIIDQVLLNLKNGYKRILINLPTGGGKTAIASELVRRSIAKNNSSMFLCHREELIKQTVKTYKKNGVNPGIIKAGIDPDYDNFVQVASVPTLARRLEYVNAPKILFLDECHHAISESWKKVINSFPNAYIIGLTATPIRLDGQPLAGMFETMVEGITTRQLIDRGYLSKFDYYAPSIIDTSELKISNGEYTKQSVAQASFTNRVIGDNIEAYKKLCNGKRNVVFACNIKHGKEICKRYNDAGIPAEFLDGMTAKDNRADTLARFESGETKVLVNVDLFGEGFDLPSIECISMLRPTNSLGLYLQQVGRALRTADGKEKAIILDHVNNYQRHGMPDEERIWSLNIGSKNGKRKNESDNIRIKRCPHCFYAHSPALVCPNCGHKYESDGKTIREVKGELVLIGSSREEELKKEKIKEAKTYSELVEVEKEMGYKVGWAENRYKILTGKDLKSNLDGYKEIARVRGYAAGWAWIQWKRKTTSR